MRLERRSSWPIPTVSLLPCHATRLLVAFALHFDHVVRRYRAPKLDWRFASRYLQRQLRAFFFVDTLATEKQSVVVVLSFFRDIADVYSFQYQVVLGFRQKLQVLVPTLLDSSQHWKTTVQMTSNVEYS